MNTLPTWCSDSPAIGSYVARACPYDHDPLREPLDATAKLLKQSTDTFVEWIENKKPLQLGRLDFTQESAWHSLSGQLVQRYRQSHWDLLNKDPDYRDALGEAVDRYNAQVTKPRTHLETASTRKKRYIQEGQHLVKVAVEEGLATNIATYAVVPGVIRVEKPHMSLRHQANASEGLLPAAADFSRSVARQSKRGNARFLRSLAGLSEFGHIHYPTLTYRPQALQIITDEKGREALSAVEQHHESKDLAERFRGCPALMYGSVTTINKLMAQIILENDCYQRAFI